MIERTADLIVETYECSIIIQRKLRETLRIRYMKLLALVNL